MHIERSGPASGARQVVLVLPRGRATSLAPSPRGLAYLRMVPFARAAPRAADEPRVEGVRALAPWRTLVKDFV